MKLFLRRYRAFSASARAWGCSPLPHLRWLGEWSRAQRKSASSMVDERPWMTFASIAFLDRALRPDMRVYEWGSGGSTLFFSRRAKEVTAIENDAEWAAKVRSVCSERGYSNVTVEYLSQDEAPALIEFDGADPDAFISNSALHLGRSFRNYATHIAKFPDGHFDLVVVDGRVRPSCIKQGMPKVKRGGMLVLDNAERSWYQRGRALLADWKLHDFSGPTPYGAPFSQTVVWQKPG